MGLGQQAAAGQFGWDCSWIKLEDDNMEHTLPRNYSNHQEIKRTGWMLCLYTLIFSGVSYLVANFLIQQAAAENGGMLSQVAWEAVSESGLPYLLALAVGLLIIWGFRRQQFFQDITSVHQKINVKVFLILLCAFVGIQFIFPYFSAAVESLFNLFGLSLQSQMEAASASSTTLSMLIYSSLAAPICEELVFRGAVLHSLEKFGRPFAMIVSSALFGIYHGNFTQGVFAFCAGMILSYTALRFSLKWAIVLHMFNNFVLGDLFSFATANLPATTQTLLLVGIQVIGLVIALYFLIKQRQQIAAFFKNQPTESGAVKSVLTSAGLLIFTGVNLYMAIGSVQPLLQ
ncbi:CPBP family intramembrane glutamic endopeptidase [Enterococcus sp. LJL120]